MVVLSSKIVNKTKYIVPLRLISLDRDVAQWLERGALPLPLNAVRVQRPLGAGFQRNIIMFLPSLLGDIVPMFVSLGKALYPHTLHLTKVYMNT